MPGCIGSCNSVGLLTRKMVIYPYAMAPRKTTLLNYIIIDLPAPGNLRYAWSFGSLLGLFLRLQIVTGLILSIHYSSGVREAYERVIHIQREVIGGWALRSLHSNGASFFFIIIYFHMARGLYYGSHRNVNA